MLIVKAIAVATVMMATTAGVTYAITVKSIATCDVTYKAPVVSAKPMKEFNLGRGEKY